MVENCNIQEKVKVTFCICLQNIMFNGCSKRQQINYETNDPTQVRLGLVTSTTTGYIRTTKVKVQVKTAFSLWHTFAFTLLLGILDFATFNTF